MNPSFWAGLACLCLALTGCQKTVIGDGEGVSIPDLMRRIDGAKPVVSQIAEQLYLSMCGQAEAETGLDTFIAARNRVQAAQRLVDRAWRLFQTTGRHEELLAQTPALWNACEALFELVEQERGENLLNNDQRLILAAVKTALTIGFTHVTVEAGTHAQPYPLTLYDHDAWGADLKARCPARPGPIAEATGN